MPMPLHCKNIYVYIYISAHFLFAFSADTSEYMRNGDFVPTRIQAQQDAVNLVCLSKTKSNPENNVGLITMSPRLEES